MQETINITYPEYLAQTLKLSKKDFETEMKISSLVKLYELGKVSSGIAVNIMGISTLEFLDLLSKYKVSVFGEYDTDELNEDIANA